jgi:5-methylcytosine-specific restriction endonuclease McrA
MSKRQEFSKSVKLSAWTRCEGHCEGCHAKVLGTPEYHHIVAAALGGSNDIGNVKVLCSKCHRIETSTVTVPTVAKAIRVFEKCAGVRKKQRFRKPPAGWDSFNRRWKD